MRGPLLDARDGVILLVRATPKSSRDAILGLVVRGDEVRVAVKVRAAPHDGDANLALISLIARSIGCKPSAVSVAAGAKDRDKTLRIGGISIDQAAAWLSGLRTHGDVD